MIFFVSIVITLITLVMVIVVIIVAIVAAVFALFLATTLCMFTTFFAAVPDRVGNDIQMPNWMMRVVTVDH